MDGKLSEIIEIIIIVIVVLLSAYSNYLIIDNKIYDSVNSTTVQFEKNIRNKGYVTSKDYDSYLNDLSNNGQLYDVEMTHTNILYYPLSSSSKDYTAEKPYKEEDFKYGNSSIFASIYNKTNPTDYKMAVGDDFSVKVYNRGNLVRRIFGRLTNSSNQAELVASYGGAIGNEDN